MFALLCGITTCIFVIKAVDKKSDYYFILTGVATIMTFLSKQNFGMALLLALFFYALLYKPIRKVRYVFYFVTGMLICILPVLVYFLATNTLTDFFRDMYFFMIEKTVIMDLQKTPIIYPGPLPYQIIKTLFYLSPLLLSFLATMLCFKTNKKLIILPLFCIFFYLFGIRPTTDYTHLMPLLSITGIPLALIMTMKKNFMRYGAIIAALALIGVGSYDLLFRNYYRWDEPILTHSYPSPNPRLSIWTSKKAADTLAHITPIINAYSKPKDFLFIYSYAPLYYLILDRRNPTRFDFFPPLTRNDKIEIITSLKKKNVPLILTLQPLETDKSAISEFIKRHYTVISKKYLYVWKKKDNLPS